MVILARAVYGASAGAMAANAAAFGHNGFSMVALAYGALAGLLWSIRP